MRILVIHGPNLNLLGTREPDVYGTQTLADVDEEIGMVARELGAQTRTVQHNSEGAIVDELHAANRDYDAVVINPGAYTHYSYAIADAVSAIDIPVVECHISNTDAREAFRRTSVIAPNCVGSVRGFGSVSYTLAIRAAVDVLTKRSSA